MTVFNQGHRLWNNAAVLTDSIVTSRSSTPRGLIGGYRYQDRWQCVSVGRFEAGAGLKHTFHVIGNTESGWPLDLRH